jgi:hypothetical protein
MLDPDARVMPEIDIDAAFRRSSSVTVNIRNFPKAGVGASSSDDSTTLVSRMPLRYRGGV